MKSIVLNEQEFAGLTGLPHLQFRLYLLLRWAMDSASKKVGSASTISWGWMGRELEVYPARGRHVSQVGKPSESALRSACDGLEKAGLIEPCGCNGFVVFLLPKATSALSRPKHERRVSVGGSAKGLAPAESRTETGVSTDEPRDEQRGQKADERSQLRYQVNPIFVVNKKAAPCAQPVDNFQPDTMLVLAGGFASWLRKAENARGCIAKVRDDEPAVLSWAADGITLDQLQEAYRDASWDRERTNNPHAISAPFLDTILRRKLGRSMVSRKAKTDAPRAWHTYPEGIAAKAQEIGAVRREGEDEKTFVGRLWFEIAQAKDKADEEKKRGR